MRVGRCSEVLDGSVSSDEYRPYRSRAASAFLKSGSPVITFEEARACSAILRNIVASAALYCARSSSLIAKSL